MAWVWLAQTPAFWSLRCPEGTGLCCPLSAVDPCGARTPHSSSSTASLTTANPQANSRGRAGPGYCATIQNDLNNCASLRGTAVPAVITGGTPVPQFMSLCIVQFLPALLFGVDVEGVKTPIPEPEVGLVVDVGRQAISKSNLGTEIHAHIRRCLESGNSRILFQVAAKMPLQSAGGMTDTPGSPTPDGGASLSTT